VNDTYAKAMLPIGTEEVRGLIEATVTAVSVLAGAMAWQSGYAAANAMYENQSPRVLAERINRSIGEGFSWGAPTALGVLLFLLWT
jgi:hypothetical protein